MTGFSLWSQWLGVLRITRNTIPYSLVYSSQQCGENDKADLSPIPLWVAIWPVQSFSLLFRSCFNWKQLPSSCLRTCHLHYSVLSETHVLPSVQHRLGVNHFHLWQQEVEPLGELGQISLITVHVKAVHGWSWSGWDLVFSQSQTSCWESQAPAGKIHRYVT